MARPKQKKRLSEWQSLPGTDLHVHVSKVIILSVKHWLLKGN